MASRAPERVMAPNATRRFRWGRWLGMALLALLTAGALIWWLTLPAQPDAFYAPPRHLPTQPGVLLRVEAFDRDVPAGAHGWRILYTSTHGDGAPALASAIVLAPAQRGDHALPVIAWTHGTTGVASGCAPSLLTHPFANVPALPQALAQGWAVVATDYIGLGTHETHGYLMGEDEARAALDAVRAAHRMGGLALADNTVVWGHSQGGHAALWTGIVAPSYAPEVRLMGVAALAPASDLPALLHRDQDSLIGRMLSAYITRAYVAHYPALRFDDLVRPWAAPLAHGIAGRCLAGADGLVAAGEAALLRRSLFRDDPASGPLGERLAQNVPGAHIAAPLLIAQGLDDTLVWPDIQDAFVRGRCAAGQALRYRRYEGRDHLTLVAADSPLTTDLLAWTQQRFAGVADGGDCASR